MGRRSQFGSGLVRGRAEDEEGEEEGGDDIRSNHISLEVRARRLQGVTVFRVGDGVVAKVSVRGEKGGGLYFVCLGTDRCYLCVQYGQVYI